MFQNILSIIPFLRARLGELEFGENGGLKERRQHPSPKAEDTLPATGSDGKPLDPEERDKHMKNLQEKQRTQKRTEQSNKNKWVFQLQVVVLQKKLVFLQAPRQKEDQTQKAWLLLETMLQERWSNIWQK